MNWPFWLNAALLIVGAAVIFKTTEWFVRGTVDIATALRLPKMFIGITLVSLVTTAPEFIVSVASSYLGEPGMAVGNSVGTFICNIGLVFSVGIILKEVRAKKEDFLYRIGFLIAVLLVMYLFCLDGALSRREALVLLVLLAIFFVFNYRLALLGREKIPAVVEPDKRKDILKKGVLFFLFGGLGTVAAARYGLLGPGLNIAHALKIPPILIGLTVMAVGTSMPELFTAIVSSRKDHGEIALGNVIGANVLNLLWVLGVAALVNPLPIDAQTLRFTLPAAAVFSLLLLFLGMKRLKYTRKNGVLMLSLYFAYVLLVILVLY